MAPANDSPHAFLITFTCYGTWLHGDAKGSVDRQHNEVGRALLPDQPALRRFEAQALAEAPYLLDAARRPLVLEAILGIARQRGWQVFAAHIRGNHVHVVVHADRSPERVMNDFKAFASKRLNEVFPEERDRKRWTRHGSTRYLNTEESCLAAIRYVVEEQGDPMAVYRADLTTNDPPNEPRTK